MKRKDLYIKSLRKMFPKNKQPSKMLKSWKSKLNLKERDVRKGKVFQLTLPVSVEDVYTGKTIKTKYLKDVACDHCRGTGADNAKSLKSCPKCGGNGFGVR